MLTLLPVSGLGLRACPVCGMPMTSADGTCSWCWAWSPPQGRGRPHEDAPEQARVAVLAGEHVDTELADALGPAAAQIARGTQTALAVPADMLAGVCPASPYCPPIRLKDGTTNHTFDNIVGPIARSVCTTLRLLLKPHLAKAYQCDNFLHFIGFVASLPHVRHFRVVTAHATDAE